MMGSVYRKISLHTDIEKPKLVVRQMAPVIAAENTSLTMSVLYRMPTIPISR